MAIYVPKQNPDYRVELAELINGYLAEREWSPARLARESGQSKATISRITNYKNGNPKYQPLLRTIQAIALALKLSREQRKELFDTAFPEFRVWDEVAEQGYPKQDTPGVHQKRLCPADGGAPRHRHLRHPRHPGKHRHLQPEKLSDGRLLPQRKEDAAGY